MHFITIEKLQREFGLSFVTAGNLIAEQHRLARKRYRLLEVLTGCGMVGFLALTFAGIPSRRGIVCWLPLAMLPLAFTHLYLKPHVAHADPGPRPGAAGSREHPLAIPV